MQPLVSSKNRVQKRQLTSVCRVYSTICSSSNLIFFQALKEYSPDEAKVLRSSQLGRIHASELVPGDIISVAVGDKIPADCRLLDVSSSSFRIDQAILTGESTSVHKGVEIVPDSKVVKQDMTNILFSVGHSLTLLLGLSSEPMHHL